MEVKLDGIGNRHAHVSKAVIQGKVRWNSSHGMARVTEKPWSANEVPLKFIWKCRTDQHPRAGNRSRVLVKGTVMQIEKRPKSLQNGGQCSKEIQVRELSEDGNVRKREWVNITECKLLDFFQLLHRRMTTVSKVQWYRVLAVLRIMDLREKMPH